MPSSSAHRARKRRASSCAKAAVLESKLKAEIAALGRTAQAQPAIDRPSPGGARHERVSPIPKAGAAARRARIADRASLDSRAA